MPSYKVSFIKNLLSSDGHQFKCVQQTTTDDAPNPQAAVDAAKRQFEKQWQIPDWRLHADEMEAAEVPDLTDAETSS
jgi:hypothetical protein